MEFLEYVEPIIKWVPTLLFLFVILMSTITGYLRGFRKSLIFLIHSVVIGSICIVFYFLFKDSSTMDEFMLTVINFFMGSETGLQDLLGISKDCVSVKEVLVEFIPSQMNFVDGLSLILADNGKYLLTLVDLAYSIVFALVFYIIYLILIFVMTIIYYIFYSDKKYKKKNKKQIMKGKAEFKFRKKRLYGSLIGLTRGLVSGLIMISLLGSTLFVIAGGDGTEESPEFDFGNNTINSIYNVYGSLSEYGSYGVFKILNTFKDNENTPYYLFAADVIFSGELKLNEEYTDNVIFREEFATYVDFSKDVLALMMKYGGDDLRALVSSSGDSKPIDVVLNVLLDEGFQTEFETLIENFDSKVYFSNFAFSFIDSFISHLDETSFGNGFDSKIKDLLLILFKEGYLSDSIPYEAALKAELNGEKIVLGNISSKDLITKDNIIVAMDIIVEVMNYKHGSDGKPTNEDLYRMLNNIADHVAKLSLFDSINAERFNNLHRRLFAYVRYNYLESVVSTNDVENLNASSSALESTYYIDRDYDSINWNKEIKTLLNVFKDVLYIIENVKLDFKNMSVLIPQLFEIYQLDTEENILIAGRFDYILNYIANSKLIANIFASQFITNTLNGLMSGISNEFKMPTIRFTNVYNEEGKIVEYGETYYFVNAISSLLHNQDNKIIFDTLFPKEGAPKKNTTEILMDLSSALTSESNKETVSYIVGSKLFRSIFTIFLNKVEINGEEMLYLDSSVLDLEDDESIQVISKEEFSKIIYLIPDLIELAEPMLGEKKPTNDEVVAILKSSKLENLLESKVIEGTLSNILIITLKDNKQIIIPKKLQNREYGLVSYENEISEIRSLLEINNTLNLDFVSIMDGKVEGIINELATNKDFPIIFNSDILYYTVSNYLTSESNEDLLSIKLVIPASVKTELADDVITHVIDKDQLTEFFRIGTELFIESNDVELAAEDNEMSNNDINKIFKKVVLNNSNSNEKDKYLSNYILSATIISYILGDGSAEFKDFLVIPEYLEEYREKIETETNKSSNKYYDENNILHKEVSNLCIVFDELLEVSIRKDEDIDFFTEDNIERVTSIATNILENPDLKSNIMADKKKIDVIYESKIMASTLSNEFDNYLTSDLIDSDVRHCTRAYSVKETAYTKKEIDSFILAMNKLELTDPENIGFSDILVSNNFVENKEYVYDSVLALGLVSKMIDDTAKNPKNILRVSEQAYEEDVKIFKTCEIDAFLELMGEDLDSIVSGTNEKDIDLTKHSLEEIKNVVFDFKENGQIKNVNGYIVIATITNKLETQTPKIYIPNTEYDETNTNNRVLKADSFLQLINSMDAAGFDLNLKFNSLDAFSDIREIGKSVILRATISNKVTLSDGISSLNTAVIDSDLYREYGYDYEENKLCYLTEDEFYYFFDGLKYISESSSKNGFNLEFSSNIVDIIAGMSNVETRNKMLKSSLLRKIINSFTVKGINHNGIRYSYDVLNTIVPGFGEVKNIELIDIITQEQISEKQPTEEQFIKIFNLLGGK